MANKRMFSNSVILTDDFLRLPHSAISLYFILNVTADDEGFNAAPEDVMKRTRTTSEDYRLLAERGFIIPLDSGVIVIRHWFIHNYSSSSRTRSQISCLQEKKLVTFNEDGIYELITVGSNALSLADMMELNDDKPLSYSRIKEIQKYGNSCVQPQLDTFDVGTLTGKEEERGGEGRRDEIRRGERRARRYSYESDHLYGINKNVALSDDELDEIYRRYENPEDLIDKVSFIFLNSSKRYRSHFGFLGKIAVEDRWPKKSPEMKQEIRELTSKEKKEIRIQETMVLHELTYEEAEKYLEEENERATIS